MTDPPIERALGRLEGKVDSIIQEQSEARTQRQDQHDQFDQMRRAQSANAEKLDNVIKRLNDVEPVISKFNNYEQRGIAVLAILGLLATGSGILIAAIADRVFEYFGWK